MGLTALIGERLAYLDANIFIYAVEGVAPFAADLDEYFRRVAGAERSAITSELTLSEVLVKPFTDGSVERRRAFERAVRTQGGLTVLPVTRSILTEAARLRATTRLKLPDAIHAATARTSGCRAFVTNDDRIKQLPDIEVLQLSRIVR